MNVAARGARSEETSKQIQGRIQSKLTSIFTDASDKRRRKPAQILLRCILTYDVSVYIWAILVKHYTFN